MKFSRAFLILVLIIAVLVPGDFVQAAFSDVQNSPYRNSITYIAGKEIIKGYPDGTFQPGRIMNRAEIATMLVNMQVKLEEIKDKKNCFKDVHTEWYAPYICYAKEKGLVNGYSDGTFRPGQEVNMAEAYLMVYRAFGFEQLRLGETEAWYVPFVRFVHNNALFSKFAYFPGRGMTREEMAFLMHQFFLMKSGEKVIATVPQNRSAGCGVIPPVTVPTSSKVSGVTRNYITVIPSGYSKDVALPLVFAFHGRTNSNAEVKKYYGVEQAAAGKAIFVYPAGLRAGSGFSWSNPGDRADQLRDFALFDQLLSEFKKNYCVDTDKIFVVGHSLGAWFTNSLACARGNVIRAVGSIGGGTTIGNCTGPVAALVMHNPKDNLVPISQGFIARDQYIRQNRCGGTAVPVQPQGYFCKSYQGCGDFAPFVWCEHHEDYAYWDHSYYPHTWPKDAGKEIWKFFETLPS